MKQEQGFKTAQTYDFNSSQQQTLMAYETVFMSPEGRVVLDDLYKVLDVEHANEPEPIDPVGMAMRQGSRRVYWEIIKRIKLSEEIRMKVARAAAGTGINHGGTFRGTPGL